MARTESTPAPRPAATVLMLRDAACGPEVFMVRRHDAAVFMGGAYVFPGGRVDLGDSDVADTSWCDGLEAPALPGVASEAATAHRLAAIRELFEEAGVLLARNRRGHLLATSDPAVRHRFAAARRDLHAGATSLKDIADREGLRLALDALVPVARWITPPIDVRQFDAWFFLTRVPPDQAPAHDDLETTHGLWLTAADALTRAEARRIVLPPPTWTTLRELEPFATVDEAFAWASRRRIEPRRPLVHETGEARFLLLPGDPLNAETWHEPPPRETRFRFDDGRWVAEAVP